MSDSFVTDSSVVVLWTWNINIHIPILLFNKSKKKRKNIQYVVCFWCSHFTVICTTCCPIFSSSFSYLFLLFQRKMHLLVICKCCSICIKDSLIRRLLSITLYSTIPFFLFYFYSYGDYMIAVDGKIDGVQFCINKKGIDFVWWCS